MNSERSRHVHVLWFVAFVLATHTYLVRSADYDRRCGPQPGGGYLLCEGPPPSAALRQYGIDQLQFVAVQRLGEGVFVAKVKDAGGTIHSVVVGDLIANDGYVVRHVSDREVVLAADAPNKEGKVTGEILRISVGRPFGSQR